MNKSILIVALAGSAAVASAQSLEDLIIIDLSVVDQVTLTATSGNSAATVSGGDGTGIYFENFYGAAGSGLSETYIAGTLTNVGNPSDGSPNLFRGGAGSDPGLNFWSWSSDSTVDFTAGQQAFEGFATFGLSSAEYADMLAGSTSGVIYFPADTVDDISGATAIGTYTVIVPSPAAFSAFALGLGATALRRRR